MALLFHDQIGKPSISKLHSRALIKLPKAKVHCCSCLLGALTLMLALQTRTAKWKTPGVAVQIWNGLFLV